MDETLKLLGIDTNGIKFEEMSREEKSTLDRWLDGLQKNEITLDNVRTYVQSMKEAVENELADTPETERVFLFMYRPSRKALLLKARLRNYMLLEAFLLTPERAKKALERSLSGFRN